MALTPIHGDFKLKGKYNSIPTEGDSDQEATESNGYELIFDPEENSEF